jgi:CheY-like chemotaxis protein
MEHVKRQHGPVLAALLQARRLSVREHLLPLLAFAVELTAGEEDQAAVSRQLVNWVAAIKVQSREDESGALGEFGPEGAVAWREAVDVIVRHSDPRPAALVVERDPVQRRFAATILSRAGWTVNTAATQDDALWLGRTLPYQLMLLDYELPDGTGAEVAQQLRAGNGPNLNTYMLGCSGGEHGKQCLAAGMDEYLQKPIDLRVLKYRALRVASRTPVTSSL